jgi:hypothetical protein
VTTMNGIAKVGAGPEERVSAAGETEAYRQTDERPWQERVPYVWEYGGWNDSGYVGGDRKWDGQISKAGTRTASRPDFSKLMMNRHRQVVNRGNQKSFGKTGNRRTKVPTNVQGGGIWGRGFELMFRLRQLRQLLWNSVEFAPGFRLT